MPIPLLSAAASFQTTALTAFIYIKYANSSVISSSKFSDNGSYGIYFEQSSGCSVISSSTFSNNGSYPLHMTPGTKLSGNTYSGNGKQVIEILGGYITEDVTWKNEGGISSYTVLGDISVGSGTDLPILTVEPGVEIRFEQGTGLSVGYAYG